MSSPGGSVTAGMAIYDTMQFGAATWPRVHGLPPAGGSCSPPAPGVHPRADHDASRWRSARPGHRHRIQAEQLATPSAGWPN
ncbi:MAG: ATP-dependent Clp protease proteolytic subunit [Ilumatobacteraceae bacterium]